MEIKRHGASAYYGLSEINLYHPTITWNTTLKGLKICKSNVKDFSTDSRHDYAVEFPIEDVCNLLGVLAKESSENPAEFEQYLESSLKSLSMLHAVASGIKT